MTISTTTLTTSIGNAYVSSGSTAITFMSFCNYSSSTLNINVWVVPATDTAQTFNLLYSELELTANDTYQLYLGGEKLILGNGDKVQAQLVTGTGVTVITSYTTI